MKINLDVAISYLLAIPSHRSSNEGQRKIGEKYYDQLVGIVGNSSNDLEKIFNTEILAMMNAVIRSFSVIHDRVSGYWNAIKEIKETRDKIVNKIHHISPFDPKSYWIKVFTVAIAIGFSIKDIIQNNYMNTAIIFISASISLEVIANVIAFLIMKYYKNTDLKTIDEKWRNEGQENYKKIISAFINDYIQRHLVYYPEEKVIENINLSEDGGLEKIQKIYIDRKFYF